MGKTSEFVCSIVLGIIVAIIAKNMSAEDNVPSGLMILTVLVTSQIFKFIRKYSASKEENKL